jgi:hypothetical protein
VFIRGFPPSLGLWFGGIARAANSAALDSKGEETNREWTRMNANDANATAG